MITQTRRPRLCGSDGREPVPVASSSTAPPSIQTVPQRALFEHGGADAANARTTTIVCAIEAAGAEDLAALPESRPTATPE